MNILVTGAKGMVGTALVNNLKNIRDGKNRTRNIEINEIYEYDLDSTEAELDEYCAKADFVFNLAGVNRPENSEDFMKGYFGFASQLLDTLKKHNNKAGIMLSSSVQATLAGRFGNSEYGRSKKAGEELFFEYGKETGAPVHHAFVWQSRRRSLDCLPVIRRRYNLEKRRFVCSALVLLRHRSPSRYQVRWKDWESEKNRW